MSREEIQKLLGGYATGTLTPAEQTALFEAALEDQELFDALAREQSVRDLLRDPAARGFLLAALDEPRPAWTQRAGRWILGNAVGLAAVGLFLAVGSYVAWQARDTRKPILIAVTEEPTRIDVVDSAPAEPQTKARKPFTPPSASRLPAPAPKIPPPPKIESGAHEVKPLPPLLATAPKALPQRASDGLVTNNLTVTSASPAVQMAQVSQLDMTVSGYMSPGQLQAGQGARALYFVPAQEAKSKDAAAEARGGGGSSPARVGGTVGGLAPAPLARSRAVTADANLDRRAANLGLRYQVLRKSLGGAFEPVPAAGAFARGEAIKLRFEPNDAGFLTVTEIGSRDPLVSSPVQRMTPLTTPEISMGGPGRKELRVVLARSRQLSSSLAARVETRRTAVRSETDERGGVYVVNPEAPQSAVVFTIVLTWR